MPVPIRYLRTYLEDRSGFRPKLSAREQDRADRIMTAAEILMARYGRTGLTLASLAAALRMSPSSIRRLFPDLHSLLHEILQRHLLAISRAMGEVPHDRPDRQAACRAVYHAYTRTAFNGFTETHLLLVRDRHTLPPDLAGPLDQTRLAIGQLLGSADPLTILNLLDLPDLSAARIELLIQALQAPEPNEAPTPLEEAPPPLQAAPPPKAPPHRNGTPNLPWSLISKAAALAIQDDTHPGPEPP